MSNAKTLVTAAAVAILLLVSTVCAQGQNPASGARSNTTVTAAATADRVRFTAPATVVQMRLEVYNANGEKAFDNEVRGGNVIDWHLQDGQAARLSDGSYLCVITTKSLAGRMSQKLGRVIIQNTTALMQPIDPNELTAQQTQAVGPLEENASLTVVKEGESQTATVIAHDGTDGQITRGRGALSFRIGDFFSGKDTEQMRLTEEGNLGIGTSQPKLKLDVAGMIGARDGLMFSDGSTLSVNRKGVLTHTTSKGDVVPSASGTGTQNKLAKWTDNSGTLGDSAIVDVNGDIGIGTTSPQSGLDYRNGLAPFFTRDIGTTNFGTTQSALQLGVTNAGSRNAGVGPSFLFFSENSAGAKSFVGRVSGVWENPTAGAEAGAIFFQVRANSADVNALTERMRITASGNVGIGTTTPEHRMSIAGGPGWTVDNWGGAVALQNASAIGWQTNASGNRYGIGHTTAGLAFFRTAGNLGTTGSPATYDFRIDNSGNVGIGGIGLGTGLTSKMEIFAQDGMRISGFQPFLTLRDTNGGNKSSFMQGVNGDAVLLTNSRAALVVKDITGSVGIGTSTPQSMLDVRGSLTLEAGSSPGLFTGTGNTELNRYLALLNSPTSPSASGLKAGGILVADDYNFANPGKNELIVKGNVRQSVAGYGLPKAMVYVNDGVIFRCYNGLTGASLQNGTSPDGCGFHVDHPDLGLYFIDFGFQITDRFYSISQKSNDLVTPEFHIINLGSNFHEISPNTLRISTFYNDDRETKTNGLFMVIVF
jgi:hypothetical protein